MRIALRTGGGRGVFELAGRQAEISASDLFDHEISYELTPDLVIPGRSIASLRQGKPRITLDEGDRSKTTHLYRLLSALLLLPKPKRELRTTHGEELIQADAYSMTAIKVDIATLSLNAVTLRPTDLLLENADGLSAVIEFTGRMARILQIWQAARTHHSALAELVRTWETAVKDPDADYKLIERFAQNIFKELRTTGDALSLAEQTLGISNILGPVANRRVGTPSTADPTFGLDDELSPSQALIQRIKVWRQVAERGASGRNFSREVTAAYQSRCLFSGHRLPRLELTQSSGVDAAHILPWSTHDLNSVRNGVCLNKQCHWAFDEGILRLEFDGAANTYHVSLPDAVRSAASTGSFDLEYFESIAGPIPRSRLPENQALWPSPNYLTELNRYMEHAPRRHS